MIDKEVKGKDVRGLTGRPPEVDEYFRALKGGTVAEVSQAVSQLPQSVRRLVGTGRVVEEGGIAKAAFTGVSPDSFPRPEAPTDPMLRDIRIRYRSISPRGFGERPRGLGANEEFRQSALRRVVSFATGR